eukprot:8037208-Ditylum_brightwellii.AAC.1
MGEEEGQPILQDIPTEDKNSDGKRDEDGPDCLQREEEDNDLFIENIEEEQNNNNNYENNAEYYDNNDENSNKNSSDNDGIHNDNESNEDTPDKEHNKNKDDGYDINIILNEEYEGRESENEVEGDTDDDLVIEEKNCLQQ